MTYAAVPALRHAPELAARYEPLLTSGTYDFGLRPPLAKSGILAGMSMTEKQGGSDVRANTTRAVPSADGTYLLTGHKWFMSAPMCDAFLVLAQAPGGLSCFLLPRFLPDGSVNALHFQRLKEKLGNRSNASSEVEFRGAWSQLVGEEGRGVPTIIEMVNHTRLDCVLGVAAGGLIILTNSKTLLEAVGVPGVGVAVAAALIFVLWVSGIVWAVKQERLSKAAARADEAELETATA